MDINRWSIPKSDWLYSLQRWRSSISTVQFTHSVMSDSLRPHELQHARPPCPSPLLKFTQTHVHRVCDAIQPSYPLSSPFPPTPNPSQHQGFFQWVNSLQSHGLQEARLPSFTISWSLLRLMSRELVMLSNYLILCCPLLLLAAIFPTSGSFPVTSLFALGGQSIGVLTLASVLPMNI